MVDENIRKLFSDYNPDVSSSPMFMHRLKKSMDAVEIVRQHQIMLKKRNRVAIAIAALCGLLTGFSLSLAFPAASLWISRIAAPFPTVPLINATIDCRLVLWVIIAGITCLVAHQSYMAVMSRLYPGSR